jgi:hypothetical protein
MGNQSSAWTPTCISDDNNYCDQNNPYLNSEHQLLWEYQRYKPGLGWAASENFESSDPGRYASHDGTHFGDTLQVLFYDYEAQVVILYYCQFQSVAPPVPRGYKVDEGWAVVIQRRVSKRKDGVGLIDETCISDKFGWLYSDSFRSLRW